MTNQERLMAPNEFCPQCGSEEWDRITDRTSPGASFNRCNRCEHEWEPDDCGSTTKTKHYSDGTIATGAAPLPELSPNQQMPDLRSDLAIEHAGEPVAWGALDSRGKAFSAKRRRDAAHPVPLYAFLPTVVELSDENIDALLLALMDVTGREALTIAGRVTWDDATRARLRNIVRVHVAAARAAGKGE